MVQMEKRNLLQLLFVTSVISNQEVTQSWMNTPKIDHQQKKQKVVYECDECEARFDSQMAFKTHAREQKKDHFRCDHCGMKLNSLEGLDNHISMFHVKQNIPCEFCRYKAYNQDALVKHLEEKHKIFKNKVENVENKERTKSSPTNSAEERKRNGFCSFWNNGFCKYFERCRFSHEEIPLCHFQERCNRKETCSFFHRQQQRHRRYQQNGSQMYNSHQVQQTGPQRNNS